MPVEDLVIIFNWWIILFLVGVIFLPTTALVFHRFFDRGYVFSKILGILLVSYTIWILGSLKILPFTQQTIFLVIATFVMVNIFLFIKVTPLSRWNLIKSWQIFLFEEFIFLTGLLFWSYIRAHEPSIHGLEKYMDFGFINSILRSDFFPPKDMWYAGLSINYYYFGQLITAVLTKLSGIDSAVTYNLMIATLFALTFTGAFSIGANLIRQFQIAGGLLSGFLVTLAGNLHTIYAFFVPYAGENPVPFWTLPLDWNLSNYWYPNATRFIPFTIHEFPIYSFVVSDLHGHVLNLPVVLLSIAILLSVILNQKKNFTLQILLLSFLFAVMYMTNAWDSLIYFALIGMTLAFIGWRERKLLNYLIVVVLVCIGSILFTLLFSLHFQPFVSGIGIVCAPNFSTGIGKLGPFLFEPNHCQRSSLWQLAILYGFFFFLIVSFFITLPRRKNALTNPDLFILILIFLSTLLIIIPELVYVKDIYPAHYRANTMFKLGYQAFIMLSIASGYIIIKIVHIKNRIAKIFNFYYVFLLFTFLFLILITMYPFFAINSYYGGLKTYHGLNGLSYLKSLYLNDYEAIMWLRKNIKGQPAILEAEGESYTDFARVSANTGLPTVVGWPVHEWLWRGSYDWPSARIPEVKLVFETEDIALARKLIDKYNISLVFVGHLERQKYPDLSEDKFKELGELLFASGQTRVYKLE